MKATPMTIPYDPLYLFIDGEWIDHEGRATAAVVNPATEQEIGQVPLTTAADLDRALEAADRSFAQWRKTVPAERAAILKRAAALIHERAASIATQMTLEEGKPLAEALDEVTRAAEYFEWFAESARRIEGRVVPANRPGVLQLVKREPIGPVAAFTPWNFPAITPARKLSAALAAGCSVNRERKALPRHWRWPVPWMTPACPKGCCRWCSVCRTRSLVT